MLLPQDEENEDAGSEEYDEEEVPEKDYGDERYREYYEDDDYYVPFEVCVPLADLFGTAAHDVTSVAGKTGQGRVDPCSTFLLKLLCGTL